MYMVQLYGYCDGHYVHAQTVCTRQFFHQLVARVKAISGCTIPCLADVSVERSRPFSHIGLDFAGPSFIKSWRRGRVEGVLKSTDGRI